MLEQGGGVGGWMKSHEDPKTGAVFELGPHSLRGIGNEARSAMALVSYTSRALETCYVLFSDKD